MTDATHTNKTATVPPTKPSADDDLRGGVSYGFGAKASLPLTQSTPALTYNTTKQLV